MDFLISSRKWCLFAFREQKTMWKCVGDLFDYDYKAFRQSLKQISFTIAYSFLICKMGWEFMLNGIFKYYMRDHTNIPKWSLIFPEIVRWWFFWSLKFVSWGKLFLLSVKGKYNININYFISFNIYCHSAYNMATTALRCFTNTNLWNSHGKRINKEIFLLFYRWGNWGIKRASDLPKVA